MREQALVTELPAALCGVTPVPETSKKLPE